MKHSKEVIINKAPPLYAWRISHEGYHNNIFSKESCIANRTAL